MKNKRQKLFIIGPFFFSIVNRTTNSPNLNFCSIKIALKESLLYLQNCFNWLGLEAIWFEIFVTLSTTMVSRVGSIRLVQFYQTRSKLHRRQNYTQIAKAKFLWKFQQNSYQNFEINWPENYFKLQPIKFIYSEKATKFYDISTNYLSYELPVK